MIRLGVCTGIGENVEVFAAAGFEYVEIPLFAVEKLSDEEFVQLKFYYDNAPIHPEAANCMLPSDIKVVGRDVDYCKLCAYMERAFKRANLLGIQTVVFGSGGSRMVPKGFSFSEAYEQIRFYLSLAEKFCEKYNIVIAIEPLNLGATNLINYLSESVMLAAILKLPHIGALGDSFHMIQNGEPFYEFAFAGNLLKHVHIAHSNGSKDPKDPFRRNYPSINDGVDYNEVFKNLKIAGYDAKVSVEAGYQNLDIEAKRAFEVLDMARHCNM